MRQCKYLVRNLQPNEPAVGNHFRRGLPAEEEDIGFVTFRVVVKEIQTNVSKKSF